MEDRADVLREMKICRFCLDTEVPLSNIYQKDGKQSVPLPLQIMACVAIEVFENDGMPQLICNSCRKLTLQAYSFKTICKKSDDALKIFLATGSLSKPIKIMRQDIKDEPKSPMPTQEKRREPEPQAQEKNPPKRQKIDTSDALTLNYITNPAGNPSNIKITKNIEHTDSRGQSFSIEQEQEADDSQNSEDDEGDVDYDDKINPALKLPQVQTDIFSCSECDRSFPLQQLLDLHLKNHKRERMFECNFCGRKFFTKYDLAKHIQTHSDCKPFACVVCNKQFSRESLLHRHEKIHVDVPKYLCPTCDKTFLTKEDLDLHTEKHKKNRPFVCRICDKRFVFKQGMERHEQTHADEKPHKCNYCEASFTSAIKLMRHITSHAGLRPYPCKFCGRTFLLSHHLTRHMRSHYAAKSLGQPLGQHKCDVCSMSFRRKDSLINHSAIHSMVNLRCVICSTKFESAVQVKEHITIHLSGLPYPCDKCDYSFETQDQLEEHEVKHAQMEYEEQIEQEVVQEAKAEHVEEENEENEENEEDDEESEVTEFTITTGNGENQEVQVRRSKRESKIKNYAQFLNTEMGSDMEAEEDEEDEPNDEMMEHIEEVVTIEKGPNEEETIKPIVRSEGTKVYTRKNFMEKPKVLQDHLISGPVQTIQTAPIDQISEKPQQLNKLESLGLNKQIIHGLPNKQCVNVKVGNKMMRVQKFIVTKAEVEAMAREGKLELGGDNILVKVNKPFNVTQIPKQVASPVVKTIVVETQGENADNENLVRSVKTKSYSRKSIPKIDDTNTQGVPSNSNIDEPQNSES